MTPEHKEQGLSYLKKKYQVSHAQGCRVVSCCRTNVYYCKQMPLKDRQVKEAIEQVTGSSRRGRKKVIALLRRKHPDWSVSRIRRVYQ